LYVAVGQGIFLLTSLVLYAILARLLEPAPYGLLRVTMTVLIWVEITVNNGVPAALQKFLPDASLSDPVVRRAAARVQALIGGSVFLVFFLAAPLLAAMLRDPELTGYLRLALLDMAGMSAYAYYRGFLNGKRAFRQLASAIAAYGLTKLLVSSVLVYAGWGINGALLGNVASSLGGLAVAYLWSRRWPKSPVPAPSASVSPGGAGRIVGEREILAFVLPAVGFTLASNLLLQIDLLGVQRLIPDDAQVGYYSAAVVLADAPRLILLAFSFTLLPSLSHAIAAVDLAQARSYLRQVIRLLALAILPIVAMAAPTAGSLAALVFGEAYRPAGPFLSVLIVSYGAYSVYITLVTALLAENRPRRALAIPLALLPVAAAAIWLGVAWLGAIGAAWASLLCVGSAAVIVTVHVLRRYRPVPDLSSLARIALASAVVGGVAWLWSPSGLWLAIGYVLLGSLYLALLLALRELRFQDLTQIATLLTQPRLGRR
jgi:O-antigen/teichoic acid export membrane protein